MSKKCCCNCQYYFADVNGKSVCNNLDIEIPLDRNHLVWCNEFKLWFGAVD